MIIVERFTHDPGSFSGSEYNGPMYARLYEVPNGAKTFSRLEQDPRCSPELEHFPSFFPQLMGFTYSAYV